MTHCTDCGTEIGDVKFCPECGTEAPAPEVADTPEPEGETGACEKCDSQISLKADRCPECGHEPGSHGILGSIFIMLSLLWVGLMGLIAVVSWIAVPFSEITLVESISMTAVLIVLSSPGLLVLYLMTLGERKTPTGHTISWQELWDEA